MFVILLRFSDNKAQAGRFMAGHNEWIKRGFDEGVFLLVGSLQQNMGGAILAHNISHTDLVARVGNDPFVAGGVVSPEILAISPNRIDERLQLVLG